jgi:hypothetical protein|tara:strand:+ start:3349 stop:3645 length:297 start_codon:yes stop_codon:yes gene_type:complete
MFERKNNDPINNVTWTGALLYLDKFVSRKVVNLINRNGINEEDAITLLGISPNHIHLAKKTYLLENSVEKQQLYAGPIKDMDWCTFNGDDSYITLMRE